MHHEPDYDCAMKRVAMRRRLLGVLPCAPLVALAPAARGASLAASARPHIAWYRAAERMKRLAESWGDQPYGAVLVLDGRIVGEGPSRVVKLGDPSAHAEREALRDAARRLQGRSLAGSVLYSTSRPCALCEAAAAEAGVMRMIHGEALRDAGRPRR